MLFRFIAVPQFSTNTIPVKTILVAVIFILMAAVFIRDSRVFAFDGQIGIHEPSTIILLRRHPKEI